MFAHADVLTDRMPPVHRGGLVTLAKTGCDVSRADRVAAFFAEPARRTVAVDRRVAEMLEETRACAEQRAIDLPALVRYLELAP